MKKQGEPMGAHWNNTKHPKLYQLYRRVGRVAADLEKRRRSGYAPTTRYIDGLNDITDQLKVLDMKVRT